MIVSEMTTTSRQHYLDSVNASMEDYELKGEFSPTLPDLPSCHSGFRSPQASDYSEASSRRSYSPPAWRKAGSGWFKHHQTLSPNRGGYSSKDVSPQYISADEEGDDGNVTAYRNARRIPLPESPEKGRSPATSPEPATMGGAEDVGDGGASTARQMSEQTEQAPESPSVQTPTQNNCK